jgi:glutaconyl-CoA decarboxylase
VKKSKKPHSPINKTSEKSENRNGKLLDRFKIKVLDQEFIIELYNQDVSDDLVKKYSVIVNDTTYSVEVESLEIDEEEMPQAKKVDKAGGAKYDRTPETGVKTSPKRTTTGHVQIKGQSLPSPETLSTSDAKSLTAPMPGKILEIKTKKGEEVEAGQPLVILEAMKMENVMTAPSSGLVKDIPIEIGANVIQGEMLVVIE